jgi:hypothetical protein
MGFETERITIKGRIVVKEDEARTLGLSIEGDVAGIRSLLPAFISKTDLPDLKAEQAAIQAVELAAKHTEYVGLLAEITAMKKALGA